jgi:hypothetical protein
MHLHVEEMSRDDCIDAAKNLTCASNCLNLLFESPPADASTSRRSTAIHVEVSGAGAVSHMHMHGAVGVSPARRPKRPREQSGSGSGSRRRRMSLSPRRQKMTSLMWAEFNDFDRIMDAEDEKHYVKKKRPGEEGENAAMSANRRGHQTQTQKYDDAKWDMRKDALFTQAKRGVNGVEMNQASTRSKHRRCRVPVPPSPC